MNATALQSETKEKTVFLLFALLQCLPFAMLSKTKKRGGGNSSSECMPCPDPPACFLLGLFYEFLNLKSDIDLLGFKFNVFGEYIL